MATDDYLGDYLRLGVQPGCSPETLERVWRAAVRELHPDRAADRSDSMARTQRLLEVTSAYRRLRSFEREHGRLPGGPSETPPQVASEAIGERPSLSAPVPSGGKLPASRAVSLGVAAWLGLAALGLLVWSGAIHGPGEELPASVPAPVEPLLQPAASLGWEAPRERHIRIGSTEAHVESLMGPPLVLQVDLWEYGPSHVRFQRGRVVGWYSSPLKPLPVEIESR